MPMSSLLADNLTSPDYRKLLQQVHDSQGWGTGGRHHAGVVVTWARELGARSILDYGCGRGTLRISLPSEFCLHEYDPGISTKEALPAPADLVVCTDVLEHVEPALIDHVLDHIYGLARLGAFFVVSCKPAKLVLPDGRNAHLIQQSPQWWTRKLTDHRFILVSVGVPKGLWAWCRI